VADQDKSSHTSVTVSTSNKGWTVAVAVNGQTQTFAVFRNEQKAQSFAESERHRLGLRRASGDKA
jgi:hypothetical protein